MGSLDARAQPDLLVHLDSLETPEPKDRRVQQDLEDPQDLRDLTDPREWMVPPDLLACLDSEALKVRTGNLEPREHGDRPDRLVRPISLLCRASAVLSARNLFVFFPYP